MKTLQYGEYEDIFHFQTYAELLDDLEAVEQLNTIEVIHIKKDGQKININNCFMDLSVDEYRQ